MFRQFRFLGPILVVGAGLVGLAVFLVTGSGGSDARLDNELDPVRVDAESVYEFETVDEMAAASDLVVHARVVDTAKGDLLGTDGSDPASAGIVVRRVTLQVDEVLASGGPEGGVEVQGGDRLVVAEEGWLVSGEPLIIDGLGPSVEGDDAIWFLQAVPMATPGDPGYIVINAQGRYVIESDTLTGADKNDTLITTVESLGPDVLIERLRAG